MINFAVTAYNEMTPERNIGGNLLRCIRAAQNHDAISQITIVDDGSDDFDKLQQFLTGQRKVTLYCNEKNLGVFGNKLEAIARSPSGWVITCDSDNVMDEEFINKIVSLDKEESVWYCPSFAKPKFDYRRLIGEYSFQTIHELSDIPLFGCMMNTGNQTVYRDRFIDVFGKYQGHRADLMMPNYLDIPEGSREDIYWRKVFDANDSFIFNSKWLIYGNRINIVPGLEYEHYYTSGPESNYCRAPKEKTDLNRILLRNLVEASRHAK